MPPLEQTFADPGFHWIGNYSSKDSETMTGHQAPKRSKQVLTSGDSFNLLIHARSAQMELEHYFLEPQAFGPIRARTTLLVVLTACVLHGLERGREEWRDGDLVGRIKSL